jgi:hypothetical protein
LEENGSWLWDDKDDRYLFETDLSILKEFGLPVVSAADETGVTTEEGDLACHTEEYFEDKWKDWKCVRLESTNGFVEEYFED